jgi:hypothetical protein
LFEIILNIALSATIISAALWVAKTNPILGGFVISLPLSTLIVLALSRFQNKDAVSTVLLAKSILLALPLTVLFFVPFLLSDKLKLSFWTSYFSGISLLIVSFGLHKWIAAKWLQ